MTEVQLDSPGVTQVVHLQEGAKSVVDSYSRFYNSFNEEKRKEREENSRQIAESFYELVTDFYEFGYGRSFHFAPVYDGKSNEECIEKYEREVARALDVKPGDRILDIGCGVGGPTLTVARETGAEVVGLNISDYQLKRAKLHTEKAGLKSQVSYMKGDYCNLPDVEDNSYDAICAFESTCHSTDPLKVYSEMFRVLKPGGLFVESAWAMTDNYIPGNPEHDHIKHEIMVGNGLPDLRTVRFLLSKQREAGFVIADARACHDDGDLPWYTFLTGKGCLSLQNFRISRLGRTCTHYMLTAMETVGMAPKGCTKIHEILLVAADSLTAAGKRDIFTPMLKIVSRKPAV